jgi:hypothetical protein
MDTKSVEFNVDAEIYPLAVILLAVTLNNIDEFEFRVLKFAAEALI